MAAYTLTSIAHQQLPIGGRKRAYTFLKKLVDLYQIKPKSFGERNAPQYEPVDLDAAYERYERERMDGRGGDIELDVRDDDDMAQLRRAKLRKEVEQLDKTITKHELQIEQLKNTLIDAKEVSEYLMSRRAIELALLRRVLFTQMPIEVPGLSIPAARKVATEYYNSLVECYNKAEELWEQDYPNTGSNELGKRIESIIKTIEVSGSCAMSGSNETTQAST